MAIEPIKIPQNVQIEDRIVGPLTLRQIIILGIGCGFSYAVWASVSKAYGSVGIPLTALLWTPGLISAVFAFVKVNDLSMFRLCLLILEKMNKPNVRMWTPREGFSIHIRTFTEPKRTLQVQESETHSQRLEDLTNTLDAAYHPAPAAAAVQANTVTTPAVEEQDALERTTLSIPVNKERIVASPVPENGTPMDGVAARSSLFGNLSPSH